MCQLLVTALSMEQSDEWIIWRRYLDVGLLSDASPIVLYTALAAD